MEETGTSVTREDRAFEAKVRTYRLEQLEDVFAHLDRESHPERFKLVRSEIRSRLDGLTRTQAVPDDSNNPPSAVRRLWASVVDLFVSLLPAGILTLILVGVGVISLGGGSGGPGGGRGRGGGARGRGGRGGWGGGEEAPAFVDQAIDFLSDSEKMLGILETYGPYYGALIIYRILIVAPQWARSGASAGLKEAGVRLTNAVGHAPGLKRSALRIAFAYIVYPATLGLGALWMVVDRNGRTLADRVTGVRVVRDSRH